jgi:hypothetical protein
MPAAPIHARPASCFLHAFYSIVMLEEDTFMMRKTQAIFALACVVFAGGMLRAQPKAQKNLSHAELTKMIREANTPDQYQALADYYRFRQAAFAEQAHAEKVEWDRRSEMILVGPLAKYPRPVDSSRYRYEYFTYEAQLMSQQASHYESLEENAR